jgi:hypothetical protein
VTIPYERTRALVETKAFLLALQDPKQTPRVPGKIRYWAETLLRHYPGLSHIEAAHKELPEVFGPVPPFQRLRGSGSAHIAIDSLDAEPGDDGAWHT